MFEELLYKDFKINFFKNTNCNAFEIPNFLSEDQYNIVLDNFPKLKINEAEIINPAFHDKANQHQLKAYISVLQKENYDKYILNNPILNELTKIFNNPILNKFFLDRFYFRILKSRIYDLKNFIKILIRKNRSVNKKSENFLDKIIYNDILTTTELSFMYNGAESFPHTDGLKKILSLMLYFPDEDLSDDEITSLGTTFYNSSEFNLTGYGKNDIQTHGDSKNFKNRNFNKTTFPFKKCNLYGFIKSHKSWHSVEPINIRKDFIRRSININLLLI